MKKGFTLIELLIVIAIIGILVATIAPKYFTFTEDSKMAATQSGLSSLRGALNLYAGKHQDEFPNNLNGLTSTYIQRLPVNKLTDSKSSTSSCDSSTGWLYDNSTGKVKACCVNNSKSYCSSNVATW